jgi:hypothetical protein
VIYLLLPLISSLVVFSSSKLTSRLSLFSGEAVPELRLSLPQGIHIH